MRLPQVLRSSEAEKVLSRQGQNTIPFPALSTGYNEIHHTRQGDNAS